MILESPFLLILELPLLVFLESPTLGLGPRPVYQSIVFSKRIHMRKILKIRKIKIQILKIFQDPKELHRAWARVGRHDARNSFAKMSLRSWVMVVR